MARASHWSGASRTLRPAHHEEIAQLQQTCAQPLALVPRELRERACEKRDLIGLETHDDFALGRIARCREQRRGRKAEGLAEAREDRRAWLFDASRLELGDRAPRHADLLGELTLREAQALAVRAHQPSERGSCCDGARGHDRKLTACRHGDRRTHADDSILSRMSHPIAARFLDHVELASPLEAVGYIAAVVLWLAGVAFIVLRRLRASG